MNESLLKTTTSYMHNKLTETKSDYPHARQMNINSCSCVQSNDTDISEIHSTIPLARFYVIRILYYVYMVSVPQKLGMTICHYTFHI